MHQSRKAAWRLEFAGTVSARTGRKDAMMRTVKIGFWGLGALLCTMIAIYSYRYLPGVGLLAPGILANLYHRPWLYVHVAGACTALLVMPLQLLSAIRRRAPGLHRITGRIYAVGCLSGGVAGLILAFGSSSGPIATGGFAPLALLWLFTTIQGWRLAVARRFDEHRAWMIRSFSLTFAAVTLRLYLPLLQMAGLTPAVAYLATAYLSWIPNLLLAELILAQPAFRGNALASR
jgi:hypothetical protein